MCILHLEYVQTQDEIGKLVISLPTTIHQMKFYIIRLNDY